MTVFFGFHSSWDYRRGDGTWKCLVVLLGESVPCWQKLGVFLLEMRLLGCSAASML